MALPEFFKFSFIVCVKFRHQHLKTKTFRHYMLIVLAVSFKAVSVFLGSHLNHIAQEKKIRKNKMGKSIFRKFLTKFAK